MKKNLVLRLGMLALVLTLVTMPLVSGTYAKYVTEETGTSEARVAKWGVTITDFATDDVLTGLFKTAYLGDGDYKLVASTLETDNLLAPGTSGSLADIEVTGSPEVAVKVTFEASLDIEGWKIGEDDDEYFPIVFTINTVEYAIDGVEIEDIDALIDAVEAAIEDLSAEYEALEAFDGLEDLAISWDWAFHTSDANDVKDTALGDLLNAPTIEFELTVRVEQIEAPTPVGP